MLIKCFNLSSMNLEFICSDITVLVILTGITLTAVWLDRNVKFFKQLGAVNNFNY